MFLVVLWRLRYKLSLRNLAEMFLNRGFTFTHEVVGGMGAVDRTLAHPAVAQTTEKKSWQ